MSVKYLEFTSYLDNIKEINSSFDMGTLKVAYYGDNRNGSDITRDAFEDAVTSLYNVPVVTNYKKDKKDIYGNQGDLGGHDSHKEIVKGKRVTLMDTQPVGVVPMNTKYWWEEVEEDDGNIHDYFCIEVILWKRQPAYMKLKEMKTINHSMEINILDCEELDDKLVIKKFEYTALCLLSDSVEPCFESSELELYSLNKEEFKKQFSKMIKELKNSLQATDYKEWAKNIGKKKRKDTNSNENLEVDFSNKNINDKKEDESVNKIKIAENFKLTVMQLYDVLYRAVCEIKYDEEWYGEIYQCCKYWLRDFDMEYTYCFDYEKGIEVKIPYTMDGDNPVVNFEEAKRIKYIAQDWEEGSQREEMDNMDDMMDSEFSKTIKSIKTDFANAIKTKLEESFNSEKEKINSELAVKTTEVETYSNELETTKTNLNNISVELESIKADYVDVTKKFSNLEEVIKEKDLEINTLKDNNSILEQFKLDEEKAKRKEKADLLFADNADLLSEEDISKFSKKLDDCNNFADFEKELQSFLFVKSREKNKTIASPINYSYVENPKKPSETQSDEKNTNRWAVYSKEYNK